MHFTWKGAWASEQVTLELQDNGKIILEGQGDDVVTGKNFELKLNSAPLSFSIVSLESSFFSSANYCHHSLENCTDVLNSVF